MNQGKQRNGDAASRDASRFEVFSSYSPAYLKFPLAHLVTQASLVLAETEA